MSKLYKWLLMMMILISGFTPHAFAQDPSFDITQRDVLVDITAEGDGKYTETITFQIDYLNGIQHVIDFNGVEMGDYQVGVLNPTTNRVEYFSESPSHAPETFQTYIEDNKMTFRVYYPSERETVKFVFNYTLKGVVTNYSDTAEFNGKIVGDETNEAVDVTAEIRLPGKVETKESFRAWLFGDPQGQISLDNTGNYSFVKVDVPNSSANQFVEVQTLFPTSLTPNNKKVENRPRMQEVLDVAEQRLQEEQALYKKKQMTQTILTVVLSLLGPLFTVFAYYYYFSTKKKVNPKPIHVPEHVFELPEDLTPAIMAAGYLNRGVNTDDFSATIVDLARKGYIELVEETTQKRSSIFNRGDNKTIRIKRLKEIEQNENLQKHEIYVYNYLFSDQASEVVLSDIETAIHKSTSFAKQQNRLWTRFKDYVEAVGAKYYSQSQPYNIKSKFFAITTFIGSLLLPLILMIIVEDIFNKDYFISLLLIFGINILATIILFILVFRRPIYTEQEDYKRRQWQAFEKMLNDIGQFNMREVASLPLWDEYLVYAISFGVADKVIEAMNSQYAINEMEDSLSMPRPFYSNPYLITRALQGSINSSVLAAQPKTNSNIGKYSGTNTGGFGGGASSGSSGGFGGGGGTSGF